MAQARIKINDAVGSNDDLPIGVVVVLTNQGTGGETSYFWQILDQPPGPAVSLLPSSTAPSVSFTPTKEGSYLIQLTVNGDPELTDRAVAAIRFLKTRERAPAAQEQTEVDTIKGWSDATNSWFASLNDSVSDPGILVGVAGASFSKGQILTIAPTNGAATIKSGLPGEEILPRFVLADGDNYSVDPLFICLGGVDGSSSTSTGALIKARLFGLYSQATFAVTPSVGAPVYVNSAGQFITDFLLAAAPRRVGVVVKKVADDTFAISFNGLSVSSAGLDLLSVDSANVGLAPANVARLINDGNTLKASIDGGAYVELNGGSSSSQFDLGFYFNGIPDASEVLLRYDFNQDIDFPVDFLGSHGSSEVAATSDTTLRIKKNNTNVASITFAAGDDTAVFGDALSGVSFVAGDVLRVVFQASVDASISGISINLKGNKV